MQRLAFALAFAVATIVLAVPQAARAQDNPAFTSEQLAQMLAPIALYPDALLSQVLMAATYPSDVAEAVVWAKANQNIKGDDAVKAVESKPWDPSVQSLVAFPQVLAIMGEKPDWVQNLGDAFLAQPNAVMDSVQQLRSKAQQAGNLKSGEQITVSTQAPEPRAEAPPPGAPPVPQQVIVIQPASPQVVFVPSYNPSIFGPWWYPSYPPFYMPPPPGWGFAAGVVTAGIAWGVAAGVNNALWGGMNWGRGDVNINVNRYNNINVNNRINSNNNNVNWKHNNANRNGVPYRDARTRQANQGQLPGRDNRQDYRGRDAQRAQAESALSNRVGASNMDRAALQNVDRNNLQNRGGGGQFGGGDRDRPQNANLSQVQRQRDSGGNDNALRGAGNGAQTRQQIDRGAASRESMQRASHNTGSRDIQRPQNVQRPSGGGGGGGGASRPQAHRGGAGGGGGGRPAGGGGGGRGGRR